MNRIPVPDARVTGGCAIGESSGKAHRVAGLTWRLSIAALLWVAVTGTGSAQTANFVPPPRTIADVTAILDQEKPNPAEVAKLAAAANAEPPAGATRAALARFYYDRGQARSTLGRAVESISDAKEALKYGEGSVGKRQMGLFQQFFGLQSLTTGDLGTALKALREIENDTGGPGTANRLANTYRHLVDLYIKLGDLKRADVYVQKSEAWLGKLRESPEYVGYAAASAESDVAAASGQLAEARGQYREAEAFYRRAEKMRREAMLQPFPGAPPRSQQERAADFHAAELGWVESRQGRVAEGEADVRRALLDRLQTTGNFNLRTSRFIGFLATSLEAQGRYAEAEKLLRRQLEIYRTFKIATDAQFYAAAMGQFASNLSLQGRYSEAADAYKTLDESTRNWEAGRREEVTLTAERIFTLYGLGDLSSGVAAAERLVTRQTARYGEQHAETAMARGLLALGLSRAGHDDEALVEFRLAVPILISASREMQSSDEGVTGAATRTQNVIEAYIPLLARKGGDGIEESFKLAEGIRAHSVQKALAASAARAAIGNPALAALARNEQDLVKQVNAHLGLLNNVLAQPPEQRSERTLGELRDRIELLRKQRTAARREISEKFRDYAALTDPQPSAVDEVRSFLRPGEAYVSFYFGQGKSYVWVVPKQGPVAFATIPLSADELGKKVAVLRKALEPNASTLEDIPPFDVRLAHDLYSLLLKPVEAAWRPARSLIVATNGALGLLPLGLLPTKAVEIKATSGPAFAEYRGVPWLARSHAVTIVPSAAALLALRRLPIDLDKREPLIGFGDPYFNREQAREAEQQQPSTQVAAAISMRGLPLRRRSAPHLEGANSATLASLPRLPDTADELKAVALVLKADPSKVLHLGRNANEAMVENSDLSRYRIVAFATHGLVPGELDGLQQPALALSAPDVAGVAGDGLLTMDKILGLKLDADWVVLSACNTGAGAAGAGAEAASGLGQAFFYAGTRAILVTNWSVHSQSARALVTDLFRRQIADPTISRAEALRGAMMGLLDGKGYTDENGETLFTYGHPLFWAPYTIIGDGG